MAFIGLEKLINFTPGYRKTFRVNQHEILLMNVEGTPFIIASRCPHQQWPLLNATIVETDIICGLHNARFSLKTGDVRDNCKGFSCASLKIYKVYFEGNQIGVNWH